MEFTPRNINLCCECRKLQGKAKRHDMKRFKVRSLVTLAFSRLAGKRCRQLPKKAGDPAEAKANAVTLKPVSFNSSRFEEAESETVLSNGRQKSEKPCGCSQFFAM